MRALRVPRPRLLQPHTGSHTPAGPPEPWPSEFDIELARRAVHRYMVLDPVADRQPVSFAQLVLLYDQQHRALLVMSAALDRERAR